MYIYIINLYIFFHVFLISAINIRYLLRILSLLSSFILSKSKLSFNSSSPSPSSHFYAAPPTSTNGCSSPWPNYKNRSALANTPPFHGPAPAQECKWPHRCPPSGTPLYRPSGPTKRYWQKVWCKTPSNVMSKRDTIYIHSSP